VRSIKEECLDRIIPLGEPHFRRAMHEFVEHYHRERNHQGLSNELIEGQTRVGVVGCIRRHPRLGGLLNYYEWAADARARPSDGTVRGHLKDVIRAERVR